MPSVPAIRANQQKPNLLMRVFGWMSRTKAAPQNLAPPGENRWWHSIVREPFTGAWQRNRELRRESVLTYHAVYSCVTLIASDIAKCRPRLVEQDAEGIWNEIEVAAFTPVLRKPNRYQNRIKFFEQWIVSKLLHGNTYVLKQRDERTVVVALYVLDPTRVKVLIAPDGAVFYQIARDNLSGVTEDNVTVPSKEIIHDVMVPLYHPLCGVSPLTACGVAAVQGLAIQNNSAAFFENGSRPGGVLTAPGMITDETAVRLKEHWEQNYTGENAGRIAVLGDGLKFEQMAVKAVDAQLIEQLQWSAKTVCSTFHVPAYKVGVGDPPAYNNIEGLERQYYQQCLQKLFECVEICLDEGLGLVDVPGKRYGAEFDLDDLLRMDTAAMYESEVKVVRGSVKAPNEARKRLGLKPVAGGDSPLAQHQDYSLAALAKRDAKDDPFASTAPAATAAKPPSPNDEAANNNQTDEELAADVQIAVWKLKSLLASRAA